MSLTRIGSIGINTGIAFAGVTTIVTLNTANDALSIGATVNVGSGITLGASGDIFATGVSTVTTLKVGTGVTVSSDGDVFFTGIATGNGSGLTALNASNISSGTVPTARLGSGTASSSTFLRGDSTFQTVNTDLVSDTSPQLGGNLDTNDKNIVFGDSDGGSGTDNRAVFGTNSDLSIYHDGSHSYVTHNGTGNFYVSTSEAATEDLFLQAGNDVYIRPQTGENGIKVVGNGAVELYHDNSQRLITNSQGIRVKNEAGGSDTKLNIVGPEGYDGILNLIADDGDDDADHWRLLADASGPDLYIQDYSSGAYVTDIRASGGGQVELYHNGSKRVTTTSSGVSITRQNSGEYFNVNANYGASGDQAIETTGDLTFYTNSGSIAARLDQDGLKFNADTSANNALDDYEEGTCNPTQVNGSFNPTNNDGKYTKVGRLVTWMMSITFDSTASGNHLTIGNFPFTAGGGRPGGAIIRYSNDDEAYEISFHVDAGAATASCYYLNGGGIVQSNAVSDKRFDLTFVYEAA